VGTRAATGMAGGAVRAHCSRTSRQQGKCCEVGKPRHRRLKGIHEDKGLDVD
jgi:hypothetical protein